MKAKNLFAKAYVIHMKMFNNNRLTNFSKAPLICQIQQETLYLALEFSMKPTDNLKTEL